MRRFMLLCKFCFTSYTPTLVLDIWDSCSSPLSAKKSYIIITTTTLWLSDSKSPQVDRTLLNILVDLNNAIFWMFSPRPLISKPSSSTINLLVTVPSTPNIIGITITFKFHSFFFSSLARSRYLSLFSFSLN